MKKTSFIIFCSLSYLLPFSSNAAYEWSELPGSFVKDSRFDISTRNMWKYLKTESNYDYDTRSYNRQIANTWGQNLTIDYKSGYLFDMLGFDASYYGGVKLAASEKFQNRAMFYNDNGKPRGYNKIGQRYAKIKFNMNPVLLNLKSGWFTLKDKGIFTNSQRLSLNTYSGWYSNAVFDDLNIDFLYLDGKVMRRDSPYITRMYVRNGNGLTDNVDHVLTGGINYLTKPLKISYFFGEADHLLIEHGLEGRYKPSMDITLGTNIYEENYGSDGKRTTSSKYRGKQNFDKNAWHYSGTLDWHVPQTAWTHSIGVTYTDAEKTKGVGQFARNPIGNSRGRFNSPAYADIDYVRDGETMLALSTQYRINPELSVGIRSNYSQFNYSGNQLREGQVGLFSFWKPMKNLSIFMSAGYGWHHEIESDYTTPKLYDGHPQRAHSLSGSMTTTYRFSL